MRVNATQLAIAKCMTEGLRDKEIADRLRQSHNSIKNQKYAAFAANGCKSSAQLIFKLVKAGLI